MNDPRREILNQVADGTISAEEGAARLEVLESEPGSAPVATPAGAGVRQVRVVARLGNTEVIGDPSVSYVVADGPHKARQDGDVMVIEQSPLDDDSGFEYSRPMGRVRIPGIDIGAKLTVRMNPALALSAKTQAGNLTIRGLNSAVSAEVQAGNCDIAEFSGPINLKVTAGNVTAGGRLDGGASAIRCQMGEVRVVLDKSSSVRINARSTMGEVTFENDQSGGRRDMTLGSGAGTLECDCTMGTIRIAVK
jgi:putative adhesin